MNYYKNDPFTDDICDHPQLTYQEFLKLLIEFEKNPSDNCLSVFLKNKFNRQSFFPSYHIDCNSSVSRSGDCDSCNICKTGKYNRDQFLKYVYETAYSKRGNILTKGAKSHENDK